jgi:hypothetical protein
VEEAHKLETNLRHPHTHTSPERERGERREENENSLHFETSNPKKLSNNFPYWALRLGSFSTGHDSVIQSWVIRIRFCLIVVP